MIKSYYYKSIKFGKYVKFFSKRIRSYESDLIILGGGSSGIFLLNFLLNVRFIV